MITRDDIARIANTMQYRVYFCERIKHSAHTKEREVVDVTLWRDTGATRARWHIGKLSEVELFSEEQLCQRIMTRVTAPKKRRAQREQGRH